MKKIFNKKNILVFLITAIIFFVTTIIANKYLLIFNVTSVRISAALNPILGITFGWPAIIACAVANFISDLYSDWGIITALMGFPSQILYGFIPYYFWRRYVRSNSHITRLDSPKKVLVFLLITLCNCIYIGFDVGFIQYTVAKNEFLTTSFFAFLNDLNVCVFFGMPLLAIFDLVYSKYLHNGKRKLSLNEIIIIIASAVQLLAFAIIALVLNLANTALGNVELWEKIFIYGILTMSAISFASIVVMFIISSFAKKNAGLRIVEKPNGTIFVDEKRRLEFVSFPGQPLENRIKSDYLGYTLESAQKKAITPIYEDAWYTILSNQKGCPMKCIFCDCPSYGYYGNISVDDLKYQLNTIIDNTGSTHTKFFEVDFMRMGEPTLNTSILDFIEHDLIKIIKSKVDADKIVPNLSTMLPKNKDIVQKFLQRYCQLKNEIFDGNAELQFSICTTDENLRRQMYKNMSLSLTEIAEIGNSLPMPKGNKYRLNFPVSKDSVIDVKVIDKLFDKSKFSVKLTPIHETFNAVDNGLDNSSAYDSYDVFAPIEKAFLDIGWDVLVYLEKKGEDEDLLTCGNLLLPNIQNKISATPSEKKRIGIVVAIELEAIFKIYKNVQELDCPPGFKLFLVEKDNYSIYIIQSGMGECYASSATQFLITQYKVSKIINFGVVGGLTKEMKKLKVCLVERVVHYKYDCSEFMPLKVGQVDGHDSIYIKTNENLVKNALMLDNELTLVTCCSGDKFIGTEKEKTYLHETFGGDICDMESAGILLTCEVNRVPLIMFKAVSDGLADGAEGFFAELQNASLKCLKIADKILDNIASIES